MANAIYTHSLDLIKKDQDCVWHPYTQMKTARPFIPIIKGKGSYLFDADGKAYLDGISSWWVNLHGHAHPYIVEKIQAQAEVLEQVSFGDFTHGPAIELASKLVSILPGGMSKIFYSDNGSTAVEVALKIALQYWHNLDPHTQKIKVVCFKNSFHGETFGAMSASGKNEFNQPFWRHLFEIDAIDPPMEGQEQQSLKQLERVLAKGNVACFIFEPLILGVGGMRMYPAAGLDMLLQMCKKNHILTIADEVMTGFGRTGTLFACDSLVEKPDIICLSKSLTGGFLPLGATACTTRIFNAFLGRNLHKAFLHGHSYTANPLACISALASLDLLLDDPCVLQRKMIADCHNNFARQWKEHPKLKRCESKGTILALEYQTERTSSYFQSIRDILYYFFLDRGILLRPLGNVLYVLPPYCMTKEELEIIYKNIKVTIEDKV